MHSITIDIIHQKALNLLQNLESMNLIRLHKGSSQAHLPHVNWSQYKGAMTQQPIHNVDQQLDELRDAWE